MGGLSAPLRCLSLQINNIWKIPESKAIPNVYFCHPTPATGSIRGTNGAALPGIPTLLLPLSTIFLPLTHTAPAAMTVKAVFPPPFIRCKYRCRRFYHQRLVGALTLEWWDVVELLYSGLTALSKAGHRLLRLIGIRGVFSPGRFDSSSPRKHTSTGLSLVPSHSWPRLRVGKRLPVACPFFAL